MVTADKLSNNERAYVELFLKVAQNESKFKYLLEQSQSDVTKYVNMISDYKKAFKKIREFIVNEYPKSKIAKSIKQLLDDWDRCIYENHNF